MRFILVVVTLVGVILYGFLNTPQIISTTTAPTSGSVRIMPTGIPATRIPIPSLAPSDEGSRTQLIPTLTIPDPIPSQVLPVEESPTQPIPTLTIPDPVPQKTPLPTLITNSAPRTLGKGDRQRNCAEPGCVTWSYQIMVPHTMNRWEIWDQSVGSGMMAWKRFKHEVETVNPTLVIDGHMFKVGKLYLLPECVEMEGH